MSNLQTHYHFELDFQKLDQHTGGKWLIHGTKCRKDNQVQSLKMVNTRHKFVGFHVKCRSLVLYYQNNIKTLKQIVSPLIKQAVVPLDSGKSFIDCR